MRWAAAKGRLRALRGGRRGKKEECSYDSEEIHVSQYSIADAGLVLRVRRRSHWHNVPVATAPVPSRCLLECSKMVEITEDRNL
jgi:hypothetical protein